MGLACSVTADPAIVEFLGAKFCAGIQKERGREFG